MTIVQIDPAEVVVRIDQAAIGRIDPAVVVGQIDRVATMTIGPGRIDRVAATDRTDRVVAIARIDRETETGLGGRTDQAAAMTIDPGGIDRASDHRTDRISAIGPGAATAPGSIDRAPASGRPSMFSDRPFGRR
jgi:hypothetical protein